MTTRVPIRYGGTGANTAAGARNALGVLANTGGTISGDLTITGNLVVSGNSTTLNTETLIVEDNEIVLNSNVAGSPTLNSGLIVNRGSSPNTFLRWNEGTDKWGWSDDGTTFYSFDSGLNAYGQANAAYGQANAAYGQANLAYTQANAAYGQANLAYSAANNSANTVRISQNSGSTLSARQLNFVNTANVTITVTDSGDGNANVAIFSAAGGGSGTLSNIAISSNGTFRTNANAFNFVNTSTVTVTVVPGLNGNANISLNATVTGTNTVIRSERFTAANASANLTYNIANYPVAVEYLFVNKNGISLVPTIDYTLTGNTVTLLDAGEAGDSIEIRYFVDVTAVPVSNTTIIVEANTLVAQTNTFTLSQNVATINRLSVTKNGLQLTPNTHYTLTNNNIVTLAALGEIGDQVVFRYFLDLGNIQDIAVLAYNQANLAYTAANNRVLKAGDTMTGNLNVAASLITQNVEPNLNVTYNLGTTTKRFKDLWLSNSTIYLGDAQITANGSKLVVGALELTSGANVSNAVLKTGDTMTGNLTFSGTGLRILGDMSNGTIGNRLMFQTSVPDNTTNLGLMPNGNGVFTLIQLYSTSNPANSSSTLDLRLESGGDARIRSGNTGNGAYLPLTFYTGGSERMRLDTSGNLGIGGTAAAFTRTEVTGTLPTSSNVSIAFRNLGTVPSASTAAAYGFNSHLLTPAAAFTCSNFYHFFSFQNSIGATSAVTNQYGYFADASMTGATNNYGFYSNIASSTNRWNFYAAGTAPNYFAGDTLIGTATNGTGLIGRFLTKASAAYDAAAIFESNGSAANWARTDWKNANIATAGIIYMDQGGLFAIRNDGNYPIAFYTNGANERMRIDSSGNVGIGTSSPAYPLTLGNNKRFGALNTSAAGVNFAIIDGSNNLTFGDDSTNTNTATFQSRGGTIFNVNLSERARFNTTGAFVFAGGTTTADGIGITFPATQSASSNANTLDDYEEGTWTPTLKNASSSSTFTQNTGRYTKIGRLVYCSFVTDSGNTGTAGSDITLSGLPFAYGGTSNVPTLVSFTGNGIPAAVNCYLSRTINGSTSFVVRDAAGNALTNQLTFAAGTIVYEV